MTRKLESGLRQTSVVYELVVGSGVVSSRASSVVLGRALVGGSVGGFVVGAGEGDGGGDGGRGERGGSVAGVGSGAALSV